MRLEDPLTRALIKLFVFGEGRRSKDYRPRERRGSFTILEQKGSSKTKSKTKKTKKQECVGGTLFVEFVFAMKAHDHDLSLSLMRQTDEDTQHSTLEE